MTHSTKAAVIGLLVVLIVAAVALVWYILQPQVLIDTDTLSVVRDGSTITVHKASLIRTHRMSDGISDGVMNGRLCSLYPTVYIKRDATPNRHGS